MNNKKLYIVPSGGLANRMRAIASGMQLAKEYSFTPLIIWRNNWEVGANYSDLFERTRTSEIVRDVDWLSYNLFYEIPRKKNLYISSIFQKMLFDKAIFDETELLGIEGDPDELLQYIGNGNRILIRSGLEYYPFDETFYRNTFRPSIEVIDVLDKITTSFNDYTYGFHIRRTDNLEAIKNSPVELFIEKAKKLLSDDNVKIFLASDSEEVKCLFRNKYGNKIIITPYKADRSSKNGMIWGFAEMLALSRTKKILGSYYSSYSEAAAIIGCVPFEQLKI